MSRLRVVVEDVTRTLTEQWRPVVLPALVLWFLSAVVSITLLNPYDVGEYARYAHGALSAPIFHRFPLEYPAPALVVFIAPLALGLSYPWAFAVVMAVVLVALVTAYEGSGVPGWDTRTAGRLIVYLALGEVMVLVGRYDLFAASAALFALRAARRDRWSAAWTWSAVGFVLKLFPAVFWPVFLIAEWRGGGRLPLRRLWWVAGSLVVVAGLPALVDRQAVLTVVRYYLHRPPEFGGLAAGLTVVLDRGSARWVGTFHSTNVVSSLASPLATGIEVAAVAACAWVLWRQARGRIPLEAACLATLSFVVLGSKVLSVQYLMWLMPLWALYRLRVSWMLACLANLAIFPYAVSAERWGYVPTHSFATSLTLIFLARDLLVLAGTVAWLREVVAGERARPMTIGAHAAAG